MESCDPPTHTSSTVVAAMTEPCTQRGSLGGCVCVFEELCLSLHESI